MQDQSIAVLMRGTLNIQTNDGFEVWVEVSVYENKGVNEYEIAAKRERLTNQLELHMRSDKLSATFLQIPSKMNYPGFVIVENEDRY